MSVYLKKGELFNATLLQMDFFVIHGRAFYRKAEFVSAILIALACMTINMTASIYFGSGFYFFSCKLSMW